MPDAFDDVFGTSVADPKAPVKAASSGDAFDEVFAKAPAKVQEPEEPEAPPVLSGAFRLPGDREKYGNPDTVSAEHILARAGHPDPFAGHPADPTPIGGMTPMSDEEYTARRAKRLLGTDLRSESDRKRVSKALYRADADSIVKHIAGPNAKLPEGITDEQVMKFIDEYTKAHSSENLSASERTQLFTLALADQASRGLTFNKFGAKQAAGLLYGDEEAKGVEQGIGDVTKDAGVGGRFALGLANIGGSIIPFNKLAAAFGAGAAKFGADLATQSTVATTLAMGTYSAVSEDGDLGTRVKAFGKGAAFGAVAGVAGANFRELLKDLPPLVQMTVAEGAGFAYAGAVTNGTLDGAALDFMLGAALGARGGREFARRNNGLNPDGTFKPVSEWKKPEKAAEVPVEPAAPVSELNPENIGVAPADREIVPAREPLPNEPGGVPDARVELNPEGVGIRPTERPIGEPYVPTTEAPARAPDAFDEVFPSEPVRPEVVAPAARQLKREDDAERDAIRDESGDASFDVGEPPAKAKAEPKTERTNPDELESIRNREVNRKRVLRGLGEMEKPLKQGQEEVVTRAVDRMMDSENAGEMLVKDLNETNRPHDAEEAAMLVIHRVNLRRQLKEADRAGKAAALENNGEGNPGKVAAAKALADDANAKLLESEFASQRGGTKTARALAIRRIEMKQDYSLEKMKVDRLRENGYKELDPVQQAARDAETVALHERIKKALEERDAAVSKADALEAERKFRETLGEARSRKAPARDPNAYGAKNKLVTTADYEATKKALLADLSTLGANRFLDPTTWAKAVKMGVYHAEAGVRSLADFVAKVTEGMTDKEKDAVSPHLESAWEAARKQVHDDTVAEMATKVKDRTAAGKGIKNEIGRLVESFLEQGVTDPKALAKAVHEVVKESVPDITEREVMDAYSDYGNQRKLDMDPLKVKARDIRAQWQKLAALDDMAHKERPKGSGFPRQEPSDAARELTKQINEGKKKAIAEGWWVEETGPGQLKSSLDTFKKRMRNDIADRRKEMAAGMKSIPKRTSLDINRPGATPAEEASLAEARALKAEHDQVLKEHNAIFGKNSLTDAQRAEMAAKSAERSAAEWERKIADGDLSAKVGKKQGPLTEAQQRAKDLREYALELRDLARPHRTPEEIEQKSLMTYLKNREKMFLDRVARNDLEPKPRVVRPRNEAANEAQAKVDMAQRAWAEALVKDRLAKRTGWEKAADFPGEAQAMARAVMTSMDLSAALKQGGIDAIINPLQWARAFKPSFEAMRSPEGLARAEAEMRAHPDFALAKRAGLKFNEANSSDITKMEEVYQSRFIEKIPKKLGGGLVRGSSRQFTTFINKIRLDSFSTALRSLKGGEAPTLAEAKHLAEWANIKSGSGTGRMADAAASLRTFFAPRLFISRFQFLFAPVPGVGVMWRKGSTSRTRLRVAQEWGRFMAGAAALQVLRALATGDDDTDFADPDQTKVQVGESHIGTIPGMGPEMALIGKMIHDAAYAVDSRAGTGLVDKRDGIGLLDAMGRFGRAKLNPSLGAAVNVVHGKDFNNKPTQILPTDLDAPGEAVGLMTPMVARDLVNIWRQDYGLPVKALVSLASMLGMGVNTYPPRESSRKKPASYPKAPRGK